MIEFKQYPCVLDLMRYDIQIMFICEITRSSAEKPSDNILKNEIISR